MRRWTIRIILAIVLLSLAMVVTIQVLLWTDLPRRWILGALNTHTGLVVDAESISPTWMGRTVLRNVTLRLPLDKENFFAVDAVELSHRSVLGLILRRSFGLGSVRVRGPQFYLRRAPDDRWNVQDLVSDLLLGVRGGGLDLANTRLPEVHIENLSVHVIDANDKSTIVGPFSFEGMPQAGRSWAFTLTSGPASPRSTQAAVDIRGTLVGNRAASHVADFRIEPNEAWITALFGYDLGPIHIVGRWSGRIASNGLTGAVRLEPLSVGPVTLTGTSRVSQGPEGVSFDPDSMNVTSPALERGGIRIVGGSILARSGLIEFTRVRSEMAALGVELSGHWNLDAQAGEMTANWAATLPDRGEQNGVSQITIKSPSVGRKEARAATTLSGQGALGSWRIVAQTQGSGARWEESRWRTTLTECTWLWRSEQVRLDGVAGDIALNWPVVRLVNLNLPNAAQVQAAAEYDIARRRWFARLTGRDLRLMQKQTGPMDVRLDAAGSDQGITVSEFRVARGTDSLSATGELALPSYELRKGRVQARWLEAPAETGNERTGATSGQWSCDVNIAGPVSPLGLLAQARVTGDNVVVGRRTARKLEILLRGNIDSEQVTIETDPFQLFGGRWQARGQHQLAQPLTHLNATVEDLPVQAGAEMAGLNVRCDGAARAQIEIAVPNLDLKQSRAQGTWDVNQLKVPPLAAQQRHGRLLIGGGLVQFDDIELTEDKGRARGGLHFAIHQPQRLFISFATSGWPIQMTEIGDEKAETGSDLRVLLDSKADIQVDLARKSTDGEGWFSGQFLCGDQVLGQTGASVSLRNGIVEVNDLSGDLLGGKVEGSARIPINQWTASAGHLQWRDIQMNRLAPCWPPAQRLEGTCSGTLAAVEVTDRVRALEPIRLELKTSFAGGHVGPAQFGDCHAQAFLGRRRLLIDKFDMYLMGGHLSAWGQLSPHTGILSLSMGTDFNDIDLSQLTHVLGSERSTLTGKLAGQGTIITATDWRRLNGEARVTISQSDLGDNPIIRTFYNALRLSADPARPVGTGQLNIRFSGSRIAFPSFVYFNRGVEIRGAGQIDDFRRGADSTVQGYAVGSTRVLKNVQLPGISELDRLMATLQSSAVTVVVRGTAGKPEAKVVPLPEVHSALRYLLWQQLREKR